jgi:hypothetical protein
MPKTIVPLLIYPRLESLDDSVIGRFTDANGKILDRNPGQDTNESASFYFISEQWMVDHRRVSRAVQEADAWLTEVLGLRIPWQPLGVIDSQFTLKTWRERGVHLLQNEVRKQGWPWRKEFIYLGFVRGLGGFAGGISWNQGAPGQAAVGDVCLEAICEHHSPTAGSSLLGRNFHADSYGTHGQTGAFIHEVLHALGLQHIEAWQEEVRPAPDETIMHSWWNYPRFAPAHGLTAQEKAIIQQWIALPNR